MNSLRIAIVHDSLHSLGGAERVVLAISEIFPEAPIYTPLYNTALDPYFGKKKIITSYLQKWNFIPTKFLFPFLPGAVESFDFSNFDIVISSSNSYAKNILTKAPTTHISYIHAPMRYAWDAAHTYLASQNLPWPITSWVAHLLHNIRLWDQLGADRVDVFVANSEHTKKRIQKYYRRDSQIIYPPVSVSHINAQGHNDGYFLVISRLSKYKRIELAIEAANTLKLQLVVLGAGEELEVLRHLAGPTFRQGALSGRPAILRLGSYSFATGVGWHAHGSFVAANGFRRAPDRDRGRRNRRG